MLAACTVGPGTVVTCARAGAEYQLHFVWALLFASFLAFTLQEGAARLTIVSGKTLGQCMQEKHGAVLLKHGITGPVPKLCWAMAVAVYCGNLLYECNNFAGGIDALYSFPGAAGVPGRWLQIGGCFAYAAAVLGIMYLDKADAIGVGLGISMMGMVVLFLAVALTVGCSWRDLLLGTLPSLPQRSPLHNAAAPCDTALSLVGTTAIGFNVFLSGSMARQKTLAECRRGIAFSTLSALIVSVLILIVASSVFKAQAGAAGRFSIIDLADSIYGYFGTAGTTFFALGFVSAALSSMLTVIMGSAMASEGLLLQPTQDAEGQLVQPKLKPRSYWSIAISMVSIAVFVICVNLPRPSVILVAQLFNGILLPFYCISLLLCLTDNTFMADAPQSLFANVCLYASVTVAFILAWRVVVLKMAMLFFLITGDEMVDIAGPVLLVATCLAALSMFRRRILGSNLDLSGASRPVEPANCRQFCVFVNELADGVELRRHAPTIRSLALVAHVEMGPCLPQRTCPSRDDVQHSERKSDVRLRLSLVADRLENAVLELGMDAAALRRRLAQRRGRSRTEVPVPVTVHIYDVTGNGAVQQLNQVFRAVGTGAFHAGVEVYGREYSFGYSDDGGSGIFDCEPKECSSHTYREAVDVGSTRLSADEVAAVLDCMASDWPGCGYDLLRRNCCSFCDALCIELGVGPMPTWVSNLAAAGASLSDAALDLRRRAVEVGGDLPLQPPAAEDLAAWVQRAAEQVKMLDEANQFSSRAQELAEEAGNQVRALDESHGLSQKAAAFVEAAAIRSGDAERSLRSSLQQLWASESIDSLL
ncbi:unnamed protein product [Symbiodinium natans]|uniref:PPPDE domain-containing protein n=1 Tax=Symbiodinium natans TaxID=878477 RepID=A0A812P6X9_9DINO|nr:unnamed protein product [Symbiodinium natans]